MDVNDPRYPTLEALYIARGKVTESESTADRYAEHIESLRQEAEQRLKDLEKSVIEHPKLSNIQKAAWLEAIIRKMINNPAEIELAANQLTDMLQSLHESFDQAGLPVLEYEKLYSVAIDSYLTAGGGLSFEGRELDAPPSESSQARRLLRR